MSILIKQVIHVVQTGRQIMFFYLYLLTAFGVKIKDKVIASLL